MRITNNLTVRNSLAGIQQNASIVDRLQSQIASGIKLAKASDDPTGAGEVMASSSALRALDQYKRNVGIAGSRVSAEESALDKLTIALQRAKELAVAANSGTVTPANRTAMAAEAEQLFRNAASLGNTQFGETFLFGGDKAKTVPFTVSGSGATLDFTHSTPVGTQSVEIATGQSLTPTHDGKTAFLDSDALATLRDLTRSLATNDGAGISASLARLDVAVGKTQATLGETGARANQLEVTGANLDALKTNLTAYRSDLQDVDFEQAVTELVTRQSAYQAAMLATSKVLSVTLTDYLR